MKGQATTGEALLFKNVRFGMRVGCCRIPADAALRTIAFGHTTTYGELARQLGSTGWEGARDVGEAMGRNPVPIVIPCHRVLAAGGKLGGFSAHGGPSTKQKLLALEGVQLGNGPPRLPGL